MTGFLIWFARDLIRFTGAAFAISTCIISTTATAQTIPGYGASVSPAEGRQMRSTIKKLSVELGVKTSTLNAIARAAGARRGSKSFAALIAVVRRNARKVKSLQGQNRTLRAEINRLNDPAARDPGLAALATAENALDEGRLEDAETAYAALSGLRLNESDEAYDAWKTALTSQATVAELRGDYDRSTTLFLQADDLLDEIERQLKTDRWNLVIRAASSQVQKAENFGGIEPIERAIALYQMRALKRVPKGEFPEQWAATQNALGMALQLLGQRFGGNNGLGAFEEAVVAYRAALKIFTLDDNPDDWATVQNNLATTLKLLGERIDGEAGIALLNEAVAVYQAALQVQTDRGLTIDRARTQVNLGSLFQLLFRRTDGETRSRYIGGAAAAYEDALDIFYQNDMKYELAATQNNLGTLFSVVGQEVGGDFGAELLAEAVASFRLALGLYDKDKSPVNWGQAQLSLAIGLGIQASNIEDDAEAITLMDQAIAANEAALSIFTKETAPVQWARLQDSYGTTLAEKGRRGGHGLLFFRRAETAFLNAMTVLTAEHFSSDNQGLQQSLTLVRKYLEEVEVDARKTANSEGPSGEN